jgi:hypothetical protein
VEFSEALKEMASKVKNQRDAIRTEEATKNAFIMPFISTILGYDVFNPLEVIPEFTADVGIKKGEKVDYAIMHGGVVQILIECKKASEPLKIENASQLFRYFAVTNARIAVLTNGEVYQFYTDLDAPNRMDEKPFLILDLNDIDESLVPELRKISKDVFDLDSVINSAGELKYIGAIKRILASEFKEPDEDWIRFFASRVYDGAVTQKVREQFTVLVIKATKQFLNDQASVRLKTALGGSSFAAAEEGVPGLSSGPATADESDNDHDSGIETTLQELEGFQIIKAIACSQVKPVRISYRDSKSYLAVLLDDNNRKTIARLHFNRGQKYLGLLDAEKNETRHAIDSLDEIYNFSSQINEAVETLS